MDAATEGAPGGTAEATPAKGGFSVLSTLVPGDKNCFLPQRTPALRALFYLI